MDITFDPAKDVSNTAKHGVSLACAADLDWELLLCGIDDREDYGELREIGFAPIGTRVYCVVFVQRVDEVRVISLRRANAREVKSYAEAVEKHRLRGADPG